MRHEITVFDRFAQLLIATAGATFTLGVLFGIRLLVPVPEDNTRAEVTTEEISFEPYTPASEPAAGLGGL